MALLSLHNLRKTFFMERGDVQAVYNVSLDIPEGEFFTLLGPSGCGKSTILRCIAGLETPSDGEIILDGKVVYSRSKGCVVPVYKRDIGMVFQSYAIWPHMSVFDNVAYPLRYGAEGHFTKKEIREKVFESLKLVHLDGYMDRSAPLLSGGQQQRVALARALVREPKMLLLDEPLSNLDAKLREEMRSELRELIKKMGLTAVYVTHDQLEALVMSDRIAVMREGQLEQVGSSLDIYGHPRSTFVAGFIGTTNFLDGRFKRDGRGEAGGITETKIGPILCTAGAEVTDGQMVKLAIRPENISVAGATSDKSAGTVGDVNVFEGNIESLEFHGDSLVLRVRIGTELLQVKASSSQKLEVGQNVYLSMHPEDCQAILP